MKAPLWLICEGANAEKKGLEFCLWERAGLDCWFV